MARQQGPVVGSSIRVVASRTGIPADTLRVWERRYGFPLPVRRPGGSRVYSEADVARLRLVARALEVGYRAGEVVPLPAGDVARLVDATMADRGAAPAPAVAAPPAEGAVDAVIAALVRDDVARVRSALRSAALALGPKAFVTAVAQPLAVRVGELWERGELEVRHEHLVTALLRTQLGLLLGASEDGARAPSVVLATLPGEPHALGLEMVAVVLAASLAAPHLLGADTPPEEIAESARALGADAVGVSISAAADRAATDRALRALAKALPRGVALWIGGGGAHVPAGVRREPAPRVVTSWAELDAALDASRVRAGRSASRP